jgi:hypothetical protein
MAVIGLQILFWSFTFVLTLSNLYYLSREYQLVVFNIYHALR